MTSNKHLIIVLGMHRSGTSVLTRGLMTLGINLGNKLIAGVAGENDKGFFEDIEFLKLNENLLSKLESRWDALGILKDSKIYEADIKSYQSDCKKLLLNRFQATNYFGLKDPRFCKLLPYIEPVFHDLGIKVSIILSIRNPLSVSHSLLKRNKIRLTKGLNLWLEHTVLSLKYSQNYPRLVVDYDQMLNNSVTEITRIAKFLNIPLTDHLDEIRSYENKFLNSSLRHSEFTLEDLILNQEIPKAVTNLFKLLTDLANEKTSLSTIDVQIKINAIIDIYHELLPTFHYLTTTENLYQLKITKEAEISVQQLNNINYELKETAKKLQEYIAINELLNKRFAEQEQQVLEYQLNHQATEKQLANILQSNSWKITKPLRSLKEGLSQFNKSKTNLASCSSGVIPDLEFMFLAEAGALEKQAILLAESIRKFTGRYSICPITIISPRPDRRPNNKSIEIFKSLNIKYLELDLISPCPEYGTTFRILASSYFEQNSTANTIVILDSDTFFVREPNLELGEFDILAKPVDVKGICTSGLEDPNNDYWQELCTACNVDYNCLPKVTTTVDRTLVKASYNGGFLISRRTAGIFTRTKEFFLKSIKLGLHPTLNTNISIQAGHGIVPPVGAKFWGTSQACLSLAIWGSNLKLKEMQLDHNFPLTYVKELSPTLPSNFSERVAHIHYHHLLNNSKNLKELFTTELALSKHVEDWLATNTHLFTY